MAIGLAIDVYRYVDFVRGDAVAVEVITAAQRVAVPFVVLAELRAGFLGGIRSHNNELRLSGFLQSPRTDVLYPDEASTRFYALIAVQLRQAGTPIPTNDIWIAAHAMETGADLVSFDRHFAQVEGVAWVEPA